ncbi:MAG: restriction endonuclease subunit S [Bacilli bacterium]|nr:restriction endonuclease subunit S [Bacilli bacterium]
MNNSTLKQKILLDFFENKINKCSCNTESCKNLFNIETGKKDANFGSSDGKYNFYTCAIDPIKSDSYSYDGDYLILPGNGANVGVCLFYSGKFEAYQRTYLLSTLTDKIEIKYALYYFMAYWSDYNKNKMFGAAIPYIRLGNLQDFNIKYPISIKEQISIVNKIEELFELIDRKEKNDQEKEKLKGYLKEKILDSAIHGTLISSDNSLSSLKEKEENGLFDIPQKWIWCKYENIGTSGIGLTYKPENIKDNGIIVLRSSNIQDGKLDLKDIVRVDCKVNDNKIIKENDILICARNGSKRLVGKSCLLKNMTESMTYGAFMTIFRTPYYKYVYWFMQSKCYYNQLSENTNTMTINQVTQKKLNSLLIPLPPLEEQEKIVKKIEQCFELIEQL